MITHVPSDHPFISYAQNREDVVLWRALGHLDRGRYVEVGANHPSNDSASRAFYDRGWSGITVEPMPFYAAAHRAERPRDTMVEAVLTDDDTESVVLHEIAGTGLSSIMDDVGDRHRSEGAPVVDRSVRALRLQDVLAEHGGVGQTVHFMLVDTEGAEGKVLAGVDLREFRPWVLVVESTAPNSTEQTHGAWEDRVLAAGYRFCLFDGLSRFYVAEERAELLQEHLSYPACVLDRFVEVRVHRVLQDREDLIGEVLRWKATAVRRWADSVRRPTVSTEPSREAEALRREIDAIHATVSWRVTGPLRALRTLGRR
jgi:FkbM family methyltransferase